MERDYAQRRGDILRKLDGLRDEVDEKNISWSERNKSIIFTSNAHGRADIYKMKGDGSNQEIILNSNENFKQLD